MDKEQNDQNLGNYADGITEVPGTLPNGELSFWISGDDKGHIPFHVTEGPFCYGYWDDKVGKFFEVVVEDGEATFYVADMPFGPRTIYEPTDEQREYVKRFNYKP